MSQLKYYDNGEWKPVGQYDPTGDKAMIANIMYPVGSQYVNFTDSRNPNEIFGVGTWVAVEGRVVVGLDPAQTEFDTPLETGGAKTHTLTTAEMPSHDHPTRWNVWFPSGTGPLAINDRGGDGIMVTDNASGGEWHGDSRTLINNEGGGAAHNNLQPYIVAYVWRRTA